MASPARFEREDVTPNFVDSRGALPYQPIPQEADKPKTLNELFRDCERRIFVLSEHLEDGEITSHDTKYSLGRIQGNVWVAKRSPQKFGPYDDVEFIAADPSSFRRHVGWATAASPFVRNPSSVPFDNLQAAHRMGEILGEIHGLVFPEPPTASPTTIK